MTSLYNEKALRCIEYAHQHPPSWDEYSDDITIAPIKDGSYLLGMESKPDMFTKILLQLFRSYTCSKNNTGYCSFVSCCKTLQGPGDALRNLIYVLRMGLEVDADLLGTWVRAKYDLKALEDYAKAMSGAVGAKPTDAGPHGSVHRAAHHVEAGQLLVDVACMLKPGAWRDLLARMALLGVEPCVRAIIDNLPLLQGCSTYTAHPSARSALRRAMAHAIAGGHLGCLQALLEAHAALKGGVAPINNALGGAFGALTLLMVASGTGQLVCVKALLEAGAGVNKHVSRDDGPMRTFSNDPVLKLSATVRAGTTALAIACENGRAEVARVLLQHGAEWDCENDHCESAAYFATTGGHLDCLKELAGVAPRLLGIGPQGRPSADDPLGVARTGLIGTAAMHGEVDCLHYLLGLLNDVPKALALSHYDGAGPLHRAALADDRKCVAPLAELCVGDYSGHLERAVNVPGPYWGWTPAMCALIAPIENVSSGCQHGSGAALAVLLEHNADPNNGRYRGGQTLIHMAAERGAVTCLQMLLLHGADPGARIQPATEQSHETAFNGYTPIMSAAAEGCDDCVRLLCRTDKGLETINCTSQGGHTALMLATRPVKGTCPAENLECALVLLENGADPDLYNNMGKTPLMTAATSADLGAICVLVGADDENRDHPRRKANPNLMVQQVPHKGWTPLMLVVNAHSDEKVACLEVLLDAKADPNMRYDDDSPTVLHYAIRPHNASLLVPDAVDTVPLLLRYGADVNARSADHGTPLHYAATTCGCKHNPRVMTMLLQAGADPKLADDAGDTPLLEASKRGPADDVQQLIECGADPNQADRYGYTPLMAAANACLPECVSVLLKHGAKASRRDRRRRKTAREQCIVRFERSGRDKPMPNVDTIVNVLKAHEEAEEAEEVDKNEETGAAETKVETRVTRKRARAASDSP